MQPLRALALLSFAACQGSPALGTELSEPADAAEATVDDIGPERPSGVWPGDPCLLHCNYEGACATDECGTELLVARETCLEACDPETVPRATTCYLLVKGWCERSVVAREECWCPGVQTVCGRREAVDVTWGDCAGMDGATCDIDRLVLRGDKTFDLVPSDPAAACISGTWRSKCYVERSSWSTGTVTLEPKQGKNQYLDFELQIADAQPSSLQLDDMLFTPQFIRHDPFVAIGCEALED